MSKRFLKSATYSVHKLFEKADNLSFKTKYDYEKGMKLIVNQLHTAGVQLSHISHLKEKHVVLLIEQWKKQGLKPATIKNRLSQLRYVSKEIGKPYILPSSNASLRIAKRTYVSNENRAIKDFDHNKFKDPLIRFSVQLQQHFGLRREESIKFIVSKADKGNFIELQPSWTKGGIGRIIPVTTAEQRNLLDQIRRFMPHGYSLIPKDKNYRQQECIYVRQVRESGYKNLHGLRHAYAQRRYKLLTDELTNGKGWECPVNGGILKVNMNNFQRKIDFDVRMKISSELGHSRLSIVAIYCGK